MWVIDWGFTFGTAVLGIVPTLSLELLLDGQNLM